MKSKTTAGLLGIFLGGFGAHKFYLEKYGLGILYFIFSWTYIPFVIGIIEGVILLTMSDTKFHEKLKETYEESQVVQESFRSEEQDKLKKMLKMGVIDEETYNKRIEDLN